MDGGATKISVSTLKWNLQREGYCPLWLEKLNILEIIYTEIKGDVKGERKHNRLTGCAFLKKTWLRDGIEINLHRPKQKPELHRPSLLLQR